MTSYTPTEPRSGILTAAAIWFELTGPHIWRGKQYTGTREAPTRVHVPAYVGQHWSAESKDEPGGPTCRLIKPSDTPKGSALRAGL